MVSNLQNLMSQERYIKIVPPKNYIFRSLDITFKLRPFLFLLFLSSHKRAKIFSYSIDYKIFLIENFMEEWSHPSFYVKDWKVLQIWDCTRMKWFKDIWEPYKRLNVVGISKLNKAKSWFFEKLCNMFWEIL